MYGYNTNEYGYEFVALSGPPRGPGPRRSFPEDGWEKMELPLASKVGPYHLCACGKARPADDYLCPDCRVRLP
jgi:hypothetical protein